MIIGFLNAYPLGSDLSQLDSYYRAGVRTFGFVHAGIAGLVDQIDYAVKRIGIDHVGISSDFNHGGGIEGWRNEGEAGNVTRELARRGYTSGQIAKLWGGNFLRVFHAVEAAARQIRAEK